jgi:undecaprenyl diphosphate synthase
VIGSRWKEVPQSIGDIIADAVDRTKDNKRLTLNLCIGYGGKDEILDAAMAASKWLRKNPTIAKLHSSIFEKYLMVPKPLDLVIRTGGERRLSGFMLYQIEYAELFFTDTLWPDFTTKHFDDIMEKFRSRERRYGR